MHSNMYKFILFCYCISESRKLVGGELVCSPVLETFPASNVKRTVSLLESNTHNIIQDGGCGGVLVGAKGTISFQPDSSIANTSYTCIWTLRANLYKNVYVKFLSGEIGSNDLFVTSLNGYILKTLSPESSACSIKFSKPNDEYSVESSVVFLTLVTNSNSSLPPNFTLYFEGRGNNGDSTKQYRHYHFDELKGELDYPRIRGAEQYSRNEIATFVFNPYPPGVSFDLKRVDLESESSCQFDALTFLCPSKTSTSYVIPKHVSADTNWRYCMQNTLRLPTQREFETRNAYILVFTSDGSIERTGFKISWPKTEGI